MIHLEHGLIQVRPVDPCCKLEVHSPEGRFGQLRSCPAIITMFLEHRPQREKRAQYSHSTQPVPPFPGPLAFPAVFRSFFSGLSLGSLFLLDSTMLSSLFFRSFLSFSVNSSSPELLISTGPFLPAAELSVASVLPFRPPKPGVLDAGSEVREPDK